MLRVFLDCYECDTDYQRQNVTFIDYVRDRTDADLHVLVTTQGTGSGGSAWTVKFIGLGRLQRQDRTCVHHGADGHERRPPQRVLAGSSRSAWSGARDTAIAPRLDLTWTKPAETTAAVRDRWNSWVFRVNLNGNFNGERRSTSASSRISFSSSRTTRTGSSTSRSAATSARRRSKSRQTGRSGASATTGSRKA